MRNYVWIIVALFAAALILPVLVLCLVLVLKLLRRQRLQTPGRSITVRPKIAKPIDAFEESSTPYAHIVSPSVIVMPEHPLQKNSSKEVKRGRLSSRKSVGMPDISQRHVFSGRSKRRSEHFVDRDPPSDESKCDYLDPLDLDLDRLHDIYIAGNNNDPLKQVNGPSCDAFVATTYA